MIEFTWLGFTVITVIVFFIGFVGAVAWVNFRK